MGDLNQREFRGQEGCLIGSGFKSRVAGTRYCPSAPSVPLLFQSYCLRDWLGFAAVPTFSKGKNHCCSSFGMAVIDL